MNIKKEPYSKVELNAKVHQWARVYDSITSDKKPETPVKQLINNRHEAGGIQPSGPSEDRQATMFKTDI